MPHQNHSFTTSSGVSHVRAIPSSKTPYDVVGLQGRWCDLLRRRNLPYHDLWKGLIFLLASLLAMAAANAGEPEQQHPRFHTQVIQTATEDAVALSGIHALQRIEKAARLRSFYETMIRTESHRLARQQEAKLPVNIATVAAWQDPEHTEMESPVVTLVRPKASLRLSDNRPATEIVAAQDPNVTINPMMTGNGKDKSSSAKTNQFLEVQSSPPKTVTETESDDEFRSQLSAGLPSASETLTDQPAVTLQPASDESPLNEESLVAPDETPLNKEPVAATDETNSTDVAAMAAASEDADARIAAQWPFTLGGTPLLPSQSLPAPADNASEVSLSVDSVDVRTVLEMLAKGYGMNILVAPDVQGTVTANVSGLTPEQTLNSVVRMCSLAIQRDENVILVYPKDNLPRESRRLQVFPLDFARAELIEPTVNGLLSPIGSAYTSVVDELDNRKGREAIVVIDSPQVLTQVEQYLIQADQPPRQVMIEARVLEIELSDGMEHGVDFEALLGGDLRTGSVRLADNIFTTSNPFFYADINGSDLDAVITMLETTTDAKTLATPRVMVVNGQNARIQVGQQLGFAVATVTQTSTVQDVRFLDTGIVLTVTPTISRDDRVLLQVKPKVSSGEINPETLLPEESTREVETSVMLNNHQGMIIGGLIQEDDRVVIRKLPWLGDVKYVGKLFQRRETTRSRSEVIVALIPHIVDAHEGHYSDTPPCRDEIEWQRTDQRLFHGPLNRECRPWEPRLPDVTDESPIHRDIDRQRNRNPYSKGCEPTKTGLLSFD